MTNKKNIFWGLILVVLAIYILCSGLGLLPKFPVIKLCITAAFIAWAIRGLTKKEYISFFLPLALIGCQYDNALGLEAITPWILILVSVMLGVGCDIIFGHNISFGNHTKSLDINLDTHETCTMDTEGDNVNINSSFGDHTQYVNNGSLRSANIQNTFGKHTVYMTNAGIHPDGARIKLENTFGETLIYVPRDWNLNLKQAATFGNIDIIGNSDLVVNSPLVNLEISSTFGNVTVYIG